MFNYYLVLICCPPKKRIALRALQGVGGSGIFALVAVILTKIAPTGVKAATDLALVAAVFTISSIVGPLVGGVIGDKTTWRWVFLIK